MRLSSGRVPACIWKAQLTGVSAGAPKNAFSPKGDRVYRINQAMRSICVFAKQDLTKDPPFSRIDLISCCNLLIYLGPPLQEKAISLFHYALKPGGFLVLGTSESIGGFSGIVRNRRSQTAYFRQKERRPRPSLQPLHLGRRRFWIERAAQHDCRKLQSAEKHAEACRQNPAR